MRVWNRDWSLPFTCKVKHYGHCCLDGPTVGGRPCMMYTCTCTCTCTYTLVHTQTHKHVHTNTHIQIHTHTHTCTHAHVRAQSAAHTHTHTHTHTQTHAHARAHTHTHTHTNTHTHTHTHTYLQRYTKYSNNPNKCSNVAEMSIKMTSKYTWSLYLIQKVNCVIKIILSTGY